MTMLAGLDLNASRVRAVRGPLGASTTVALSGDKEEALPLVLSLAGRRPEVGAAGVQLCRRSPHLVCGGFLPQLGERQRWSAGRHQLDATQAVSAVLKQVQQRLADPTGLAVAVPIYLDSDQLDLLQQLTTTARLPVLGWVTTALAAVWTARTQRPWFGPALVLDVDDHALTWTAVTVDEPPAPPQVQVLAEQIAPGFGLRVWKERVLTGIADRCIRQNRRDPRASGASEQMLFDQLDVALEAARLGQLVPLKVQSDRWYQELVLQPTEFPAYCAGLVRQVLADLHALLDAAKTDQPPVQLVATATAARLPGLLPAVAEQFGPRLRVAVLAEDAVAVAAHDLAGRWQEGTLSAGPLSEVLPLQDGLKARGQSSRSAGGHGLARIPFWGRGE